MVPAAVKPPVLSPLRYPGGKSRIGPYISQCLQRNAVAPELFVEPFAGGASVALWLLSEGVVDRIGIAEVDPLVADFWKTVFYDSAWLVDQVEHVSIDVDTWKRFRACSPRTRRERAITCLFMNRTSFSGVLATNAGPIGGYHQQGRYRLDARFPRKTLIHRIQYLASLRHRVAFIWTLSWERTFARVQAKQQDGSLPANTVYYCDPPFFHQAHRLYRHSFSDDDHVRLRDALVSLEAPWVLSYDAPERVRALYGSGTRRSHLDLLYSAARGNHVVPEVVVTNLPYLPNELVVWEPKTPRLAWSSPYPSRSQQIRPVSPLSLDGESEVVDELTA